MEVMAEFFMNVWHQLGNVDIYHGLSEQEKKDRIILLVWMTCLLVSVLMWTRKLAYENRMRGKVMTLLMAIAVIGKIWAPHFGWVLATKLFTLLVMMLAAHMVVKTGFELFSKPDQSDENIKKNGER